MKRRGSFRDLENKMSKRSGTRAVWNNITITQPSGWRPVFHRLVEMQQGSGCSAAGGDQQVESLTALGGLHSLRHSASRICKRDERKSHFRTIENGAGTVEIEVASAAFRGRPVAREPAEDRTSKAQCTANVCDQRESKLNARTRGGGGTRTISTAVGRPPTLSLMHASSSTPTSGGASPGSRLRRLPLLGACRHKHNEN